LYSAHALASCHEAEGKLASAWAEYNETNERARRDGNAERAEVARQRAAALEPRLAKLAIMLAPGASVPDLKIKRGAIVLGSGSIGTPLPIDRGEHVIEASAPGFQPWSTRITIADGATQVLTIPRLSPAASGVAPPAPAREPAPSAAPGPAPTPDPLPVPVAAEKPREKASVPLRPIGIVAIVGGVLAAGAGTFFGLRAIKRNDESNSNGHCAGDVCDTEGVRIRREARSSGGTSTVMFVVSGVLTGGGIVLFALGGGGEKKTAARLSPALGVRSAGLTLEGGF
jgi:hypothetical protein